MPLEQRLEVLRECGISLNKGRTVDELLISRKRDRYESDPLSLIVALGSEVEGAPWGRHFSDGLWHFDTECIEDNGAYVRIAHRLRDLAQGGLPIEDVRDHVDLEENEAWLSFRLGGQEHRWTMIVDNDWVDVAVFDRFVALLDKQSCGRRYTYLDLGGQDCMVGCATPEQLESLQSRTGLKWTWLA
jgi:hypothetical protein